MATDPKARFERMGFAKFRDFALDPSLSEVEKMGGANEHREGFDDAIWQCYLSLLPALADKNKRVLDIGPGCGEIARRMIALAERNGHHLAMIDHAEMMAMLPESPAVERIAGRFPDDMPALTGKGYDVIIAYSLLHVVVIDANPFAFIDEAIARLAPGGRCLIGDIPNMSKLRRFLSSDAGKAFHRVYMKTDQDPVVPPFVITKDRLDDSLLVGLMMRARLAGFDAYLLPQPSNLALSNRREDLLIVRP